MTSRAQVLALRVTLGLIWQLLKVAALGVGGAGGGGVIGAKGAHGSAVAMCIHQATPEAAAMGGGRGRSRSPSRGHSSPATSVVGDAWTMGGSGSTTSILLVPSNSSDAVAPGGQGPLQSEVVPPGLGRPSAPALYVVDLDDSDLFDSQDDYLDAMAEEQRALHEEQALLDLQEAEELWMDTLATDLAVATVSLHLLLPNATNPNVHAPAPEPDVLPGTGVPRWPGAIAGA